MFWVWGFWLGLALLFGYMGLAVAIDADKPVPPYLYQAMAVMLVVGFGLVVSGGVSMTICVVSHA